VVQALVADLQLGQRDQGPVSGGAEADRAHEAISLVAHSCSWADEPQQLCDGFESVQQPLFAALWLWFQIVSFQKALKNSY
jgi:hypothetical protein